MILAAASQQQRRKMRIKRALEPKMRQQRARSQLDQQSITSEDIGSDTISEATTDDEDDKLSGESSACPLMQVGV